MKFNVYYKDKICGEITSFTDELYVIFNVNCKIINYNISRVFFKLDNTIVMLGVLMPKNGRYVLRKKMLLSNLNKMGFNESFNAYIECDFESSNSLLNHTIKDKNLKKCMNSYIFKESFIDYDIYSFEYSSFMPFYFDFCFSICNIKFSNNNNMMIFIKTTKNGEILV